MAEGGVDDSAGGVAPTVFISYASQDAALAHALVEALELCGLRCWIAPRDVIAGSLFAEAIVRAINEAKVFVLVLSVHAGASPHVGKEIERASAKRRPIIALRADSAPLSPAFEYYLSESQWIDLGSRLTDATTASLVGAIRRHLDHAAVGAPGVNQVAPTPADPIQGYGHGHHAQAWAVSRKSSGKRAAIDSIAVLPFAVSGGPANMKFFGEGLAECLIQALSELPGIRKVIARNSAFKYAESDPLEAGRMLGVRAVLTGRLRIARPSASLTAELVDTADSAHLWGAVIDRPLKELPHSQAHLADEICAALSPKLPSKQPQVKRGRRVANFDAYRLYLQGRYAWSKRPAAGAVDEAIGLFEKAIEHDSGFALAHTGLADCYNTLSAWESGSLSPREGFEKARLSVLVALQLDKRCAEAHTSLAYTHLHYSWEWESAEHEFKQALAISPNYANAHHWYSHLLAAVGRADESLAESRKLIELDPLDLVNNVHLSWHHYMAREFPAALSEAHRTLAMEKRFHWGYFFAGLALDAAGEHRDALKHLRTSLDLSGQSTVMLAALGHAYGTAHEHDAARKVLGQLVELSQTRYISSYEIALIHIALEEHDQALDLLDLAVEERSGWLPYLLNDVRLDPVRSSARFASLTARVGLRPVSLDPNHPPNL
jgi:TolB-like protein/Flp pilus assembly protein TadD